MSAAGKGILVVEDQRLIAADIESRLEKFGYRVVGSVASGEAAIQAALEVLPDLILMDIRLRGALDGIQAAETIRARLDVPIIYLTAYTDEDTIRRARSTSPFGYLVKPFNERELRAAIEMALAKHESDRLLFEERAKRRAAEEFKLFVDGVRDYAIIMLDREGRVASWNDGARRIRGYAQEEILGQHISVFQPPAEAQAGLSEKLLRAALGDGRAEHEGWALRKDGSTFWANVVITPVRDEAGELRGFGEVTRDVTERRQGELRLQERVAFTSALIASALDCIISMDANGRIVEFNPAAERTFGYSREEVLGREMAALIIPERLRDRHRRGLAAYLETGAGPILGKRVEMPALRKDGTEIVCELTVSRVPGADQPLFTGFMRDITERKDAEARAELLDRASLALAVSLDLPATLEQTARTLVPSLADWCLIDLAAEGTLRQTVAVHGDPQQEALAGQLGRPSPRAPLEHGALGVFSKGDGEAYPEIEDLEQAAGLLAVGDVEPLRSLGVRSLLCVPIRLRLRTLGVLSLVRSTSPRRYTEADLHCAMELGRRIAMAVDNAQLYQQAREAIRARDEFLQIASHELRTPLTPLLLQLDMLHRMLDKAGVQNAELSAKLDIATRQTGRLSRLVESLLDVSRITAGRVSLELEPLDLEEVLREVIDRFQAEAHKAGTELRFEADGGLLGSWDRLRLEQIFSNLISNAIKYGRGEPVEIEARRSRGVVRVSVTDRGIGIEEESLERIFGRFERAASARHFGGLGLGLFIARQFAEAHGGALSVKSDAGQGATFTVFLPCEPPPNVLGPEVSSEGPAPRGG